MSNDQGPQRAEPPASASPGVQSEPLVNAWKDIEEQGAASRSVSPGASAENEEKETSSKSSPNAEDDNDKIECGDAKGKAVATTENTGPWQAIYSPQYNSYYFYNSETQETTWTNPLSPPDPASPSASSSPEPEAQDATASGYVDPRFAALQQAAIAQGIDPALAYLDPALASSMSSTPGAAPDSFSFAAKFNARTGQFTRPDGREPDHVSEYERMKRMSEFYFDVGAWEQQLSEQGGSIKGGEESTKKRKRPSKKDLDRFKEQKRLKKIAKTAWLRT